ncbi:MAG: hypothetical protein ACYCQJ_13645 [Nitrososphaerales archaeon]
MKEKISFSKMNAGHPVVYFQGEKDGFLEFVVSDLTGWQAHKIKLEFVKDFLYEILTEDWTILR